MNNPLPPSRREFMTKFVNPYLENPGNPNSLPVTGPGQATFNRGFEISMKGDTDNIPKIGIKDIDEAILFHFENVLKLSVVQNNTRLTVPVIYGSPERWKSMQEDGFYRDGNAKIMVPLIMFKRDSMETNRELGNKLDGNNVSNVIMFKKKFDRRNVYDNFYVLSGGKLSEEWIAAIVPDYVTVTYSCTIFTDFVEQMDKLVEAVNFASNSYWGSLDKFQFKTRIESFQTPVNLETGVDRAVKTTFNMIVNGYLIPDSINAQVAQMYNKFHNFTKVIFNPEVVVQK